VQRRRRNDDDEESDKADTTKEDVASTKDPMDVDSADEELAKLIANPQPIPISPRPQHDTHVEEDILLDSDPNNQLDVHYGANVFVRPDPTLWHQTPIPVDPTAWDAGKLDGDRAPMDVDELDYAQRSEGDPPCTEHDTSKCVQLCRGGCALFPCCRESTDKEDKPVEQGAVGEAGKHEESEGAPPPLPEEKKEEPPSAPGPEPEPEPEPKRISIAEEHNRMVVLAQRYEILRQQGLRLEFEEALSCHLLSDREFPDGPHERPVHPPNVDRASKFDDDLAAQFRMAGQLVQEQRALLHKGGGKNKLTDDDMLAALAAHEAQQVNPGKDAGEAEGEAEAKVSSNPPLMVAAAPDEPDDNGHSDSEVDDDGPVEDRKEEETQEGDVEKDKDKDDGNAEDKDNDPELPLPPKKRRKSVAHPQGERPQPKRQRAPGHVATLHNIEHIDPLKIGKSCVQNRFETHCQQLLVQSSTRTSPRSKPSSAMCRSSCTTMRRTPTSSTTRRC